MPSKNRASFLAPIVLRSTAEAAAKGMSLTLVRPAKSFFSAKAKTDSQMQVERQAYEAAAKQKSFFDPDIKALMPCPYAFHFDWVDEENNPHRSTCDDWETAATFYRREKAMGAEAALKEMARIFNEEDPQKGMVFAMGTHSRRPEQWLLVGVLRLDSAMQTSLRF